MKKTMIAIAAVAATSGAFAEVSLTGSAAYGYAATRSNTGTSAAGVDAGGFGVDTATLTFVAQEELGAGQTIRSSLNIDTLTRASTAGGDASLTYTNQAFGRIEMGLALEDDVFTDIAYGGANLIKFDSKLNQIKTSHDYISYAAKFGNVAVKVEHSESSQGAGLGTGTEGDSTVVKQPTNDFVLAYVTDTLKVVGGYRTYGNRNETASMLRFNGTGLSVSDAGFTKRDVVHLEAGYDMGVVKFGAGYDRVNASWGITQESTMLGFSVPYGQWLFGAAWESVKVAGVSTADLAAFQNGAVPAATVRNTFGVVDGAATGLTLGAQYALSKRTNVSLRYAKWTVSGYEQFERYPTQGSSALGYKSDETKTDLLLTHNF